MRAEERYADVAGEAGEAWDRVAARERLAGTAERIHAALAEPERAWLAAYAEGVSAGLAGGGDVPELAGVPFRPWRPWTPIGIFLASHVLFNNFPNVLWRSHVARHLHVPGVPLDRVLRLFTSDAGSSSGSNAWAVPGGSRRRAARWSRGTRTAPGAPGPYQQVRLACTDPAARTTCWGSPSRACPASCTLGTRSRVRTGPGSVASRRLGHHQRAGTPRGGRVGRRGRLAAALAGARAVRRRRRCLARAAARPHRTGRRRHIRPVGRPGEPGAHGGQRRRRPQPDRGQGARRASVTPDRALPAAKPADGFVDLPAPTPVTQVAVDANERPRTQPPAELDGRPGTGPRDVRPGREAHDLAGPTRRTARSGSVDPRRRDRPGVARDPGPDPRRHP